MPSCPKCSTEAFQDQAFCENCGEQLKQEAKRGRVRRRLGSLAGVQHKKHIKNARTAIIAVAVLTAIGAFVGAAILGAAYDAEFAKMRANPEIEVDEEVAAQIRSSAVNQALGIDLVLAGVFFGLFFWAKRSPFGASLTALVIYLTMMLVNAVLVPESIVQGWLVKILVIAALVQGIKSGIAHRKAGMEAAIAAEPAA